MYLENEKITVVIQINGKRNTIECDRDLSENDIINLINENVIRKLINDKKILKQFL